MTMSAIALFCEDIREEKDNIVTLVGILPDNINISKGRPASGVITGAMPKMLAKLCIYVRINFDPNDDLSGAKVQITFPDGSVRDVSDIPPKSIAEAKKNAKENGNLQAGVISRIMMGGIQAKEPGTLKVSVVSGDRVVLAGALNFKFAATPASLTSSTAH